MKFYVHDLPEDACQDEPLLYFRGKTAALSSASKYAKELPKSESIVVEELEMASLSTKDLILAVLNRKGYIEDRTTIKVVDGRKSLSKHKKLKVRQPKKTTKKPLKRSKGAEIAVHKW